MGILFFERVRSEGLAAFSYIVGSGKEAIVVDARRDCQVYVDLARREGLSIKYVFETHRHEDFVVGSCELASLTGARVFHGSGLDFKYGESLGGGEVFCFGDMSLRVICTPGHTVESLCFALYDRSVNGSPVMVFSGDTLFAGDVGRVDLGGPKEASRLAGKLYDSVFSKLLVLGDGVILCPAHGSGSVCGRAISDREWSTLGFERLYNPVLQLSREEFIRFKETEKLERPAYFRRMEETNLIGAPLMGGFLDVLALSPFEFCNQVEKGAQIVDTRLPACFGGIHIKGSINVWLRGLASYAGWVISYDKDLVLVLQDRDDLEIVVSYLRRFGYDNVKGFLCAGLEACGLESWYSEGLPFSNFGLLSVHELKERLDMGDNVVVVDVRSDEEWRGGHISGALHIHFNHLVAMLDSIPSNCLVVVICSVGNRASLGASILQSCGREVFNVLGGMTAWNKSGYPVVK